MNSETETDPAAPPPQNNRTKLLVTLAAGVIIIIFAIVGFLLLTGDPNSPTGGTQTKQFKNWLKPTGTIKIGDYRYVSACQALPKQTVEANFGKLGPQTVVQEKYLDQTMAAPRLPLQLSCTYNHVSGSAPDVSLQTTQFSSTDQIKRLSSSLGAFDDQEVQQNITTFKAAADKSNNQDAKDFVAKLEKSFATYQQYKSEYDQAKLDSLDVSSIVLPVSGTITGALDDFVFVGAYKNTAYVLAHTPSSNKGGISKYTQSELVSELVAMKRATEAVAADLRNQSLDQSPAPTILGATNKYGSTDILEPCALLTAGVFQQVTGKDQNNPVDHTTASVNFTTKRYTKQDHKLILPSNNCARQSTEQVDIAIYNHTYANFELRYGSSAAQAESWLADNFKIETGDVTLPTTADWAASFVNPVDPSKARIIMFRVGPYVGRLDMYTRSAGGDEVEFTQDQYVQAINALTPRIKQAAGNAN